MIDEVLHYLRNLRARRRERERVISIFLSHNARRRISILIFRTRYPSFGVHGDDRGFAAELFMEGRGKKKERKANWAASAEVDAISRRFFVATGSYVAKNLG